MERQASPETLAERLETKMTDPNKPTPEEIESLEDEADALKERAEHDGLLHEDEADEDGVGPQTGVVP